MNRRRFIAWLGATATGIYTGILTPYPTEGANGETIMPAAAALPQSGHWIPTQEQVDEWLRYYRVAMQIAQRRVKERALGSTRFLFSEVPGLEDAPGEDPEDLMLDSRELDAQFAVVDEERFAVAHAQAGGFFAGRDGRGRVNPEFTKPSDAAFAWYNGWNVGDRDRRKLVTVVPA